MKTIWGIVMRLECDYVRVYPEPRQLKGDKSAVSKVFQFFGAILTGA